MNVPAHRHEAGCGCYDRPQPPACTQPHYPPAPQNGGGAVKWIGIGVGGSFLAVALSVSMVAFAIGAVSLTVCVVVLRSVWADFTKEH
ncbi:hypothetical protein ACWGJ2_24355 [Streptomyces sp. NPDC054796]